MRLLFLACALFLSTSVYCFAGCSGEIVSVIDGDTIVIDCAGKITLGLAGVDAPEIAQPCGRESKFFVSSITLNSKAVFIENGKKTDGTPIGIVLLSGGRILNHEVIKAGYAWYSTEYSTNTTLSELEKEAQEKKAGLWIDAQPEAPWEFRAKHPQKTNLPSASEEEPVIVAEAEKPERTTAPVRQKKLTRREIGLSFAYPQYGLSETELEEYYELSLLRTFSRDQVARIILLDKKVSIKNGYGGETVYIILDGNEYHKISCPELGKTPDNFVITAHDYSFPLPLNRAKLAFFPCPKCDPPQ